jgi:hypothetical protein
MPVTWTALCTIWTSDGSHYVIVRRGNADPVALVKLSHAVCDARDLEGAPQPREALLQRWGRRAVSEHAVNVDHFIHRPVAAVTALLPDRQSVESALGDLQSAGFDADHARILDGEEGARILDRTGTEHGLRTEFVRAAQSLGYDQNILAVYDEGLRSGQALVTVPSAPVRRYEVGNVLRARGAHAIIYFGAGTSEALSGP